MSSRMAIITFLDGGPVDPGYGQIGGGYPSHGLPGGPNYPTTGPVPPGSIGTLPVFPFDPTRPDNSLPGSGGRPDNSLPGGGNIDNSLPGSGGRPNNPIQLHPGLKLVVKYLACHGFIAVPDNSLPGQGGSPDNTLPETPEPK
jgi:hypothetical protein